MLHVNSLLRRHLLLLLAAVASIVCLAGAVRSQSALDGFDPNANGTVRVIVVQPDGKILIGGDFTSVSPNGGAAVTRNHIARLNPDGTLDLVFDPNVTGINTSVRAIAVQTDGKVLIGGDFNSAGGQTRHNIARVDAATGEADLFDPNANSTVFAIAVQADGGVLAGGFFSSVGGTFRNRLARLDGETGSPDPFDAEISGPEVFTIVLQPDGRILVGGFFTSIGGQNRNNIARLDPETGAADEFAPNASDEVHAIAIQADGKVLAGGFFTIIGGQNRNSIARLDATTGAADTFNPNSNNGVFAIAIQTDGRILAGGDFFTIGGASRHSIARLDMSGTADTFDPSATGTVFSIAIQRDGKSLAGGGFSALAPDGGASVTRNKIARLETDGRLDRTLDLGIVGNVVWAIAFQPDGKILIGGGFNSVLGVTRSKIARLNSDGTLDSSFDPNADATVFTIVLQPDGSILVGGNFNNIGGQVRHRIARLAVTGAADSFDPNASDSVALMYSIVLQPDGKILVGGEFDSIGGQNRTGIARLDPITGSADSFDPDALGTVTSIVVLPGGKVVIGGLFDNVGGQLRENLARLDAVTGLPDSFDPSATGGPGLSQVYSLVMQRDGKILVGGRFSEIGGQPRNFLARLDADTGLADSFDPNVSGPTPATRVSTIAVQSDGKILAGGNFTTIGGQARYCIARLDPVTGNADSFDANGTGNGNVGSIAVQPDGRVVVGSGFVTIGGQARVVLARLTNDAAALSTLAVTRSTITLTRDGAGPLFSGVIFEQSLDNGATYTLLGTPSRGFAAGVRSNGVQFAPLTSTYTLSGLNLPTEQNILIRARGFFTSGNLNSSESIEDKVQIAYLAAAPAPAITGTVTYGNAIGAPNPRFVSGVLLSGAGSPNVSGMSLADGTYSLSGFGAGSYVVTPSKVGGVNGISSFDAAKIAQHAAGINLLTGNQLIVADVSGNGTVSSFDAAQVARYAAGIGGSGATGNWIFMPVNRTYPSVTANISGEDFVALLMGEVSGNWVNTGGR